MWSSNSSRRGSLLDEAFEGSNQRRRSSAASAVDVPAIVEHGDGSREFNLGLYLPLEEQVEPSHVHVKTTDHDLIVEVDNKRSSADGSFTHEFHYERRSTLPPNANLNAAKCVYDHDANKLVISAPIMEAPLGHRSMIPIEHVKEPRNYTK